jgi:tetratricopeptide (TPR) repeat protein
MGDLYFYIADYSTALNYFEDALLIFTRLDNKDKMCQLMVNIAAVYEKDGFVGRAVRKNQEALAISREANNKQMEGMCLNNLGSDFISLEKPDEALDYLIRALLIREELNDKKGMMESLKLVGESFDQKALPDKAIDYYFQSLKLSEEMDDRRNTAGIFTLIGMNLAHKKRYSNAIQYFMQSLEIAEEIGARAEVLENYHQLAMVWSSKNNYDSASFYIQKYAMLFDSVSGKNVPVELLKKQTLQSDKNPLESKIDRYRIVILIVSILVFVLAATVVVLIRRGK